jgi:hypothetical protein
MMEAEEGVTDHVLGRRTVSGNGPRVQDEHQGNERSEGQPARPDATSDEGRTGNESKGFDVAVTEQQDEEQAEMYD